MTQFTRKKLIKRLTPTVLDAVMQTARWIRSCQVVTPQGTYWKQMPERDENVDELPLLHPKSFYGGSAGIGYFFLRLYLVTKDLQWLKEAEDAAEYLIHTDAFSEQESPNLGEGTFRGIPGGFYHGEAGQAYFVHALYQVIAKPEYLEFVTQVADRVVQGLHKTEQGAVWSGSGNLIGDGSLILFLLEAWKWTRNSRYLEAASLAGKDLEARAQEAPQGGSRWYAMDTEAFGLGKEGYFSNFFYGTAGNAFILARLYQETGEERFLASARAGAQYLIQIADATSEEGALLPYNLPYRKELYYLGMCQGSVGSSRLFYLLYEISGEEEYLDWMKRLSQGILDAGAPAKHSPGYWNTYCYCCGAAGMVEHFLSLFQLTGQPKWREAAQEAVDVLIRDSFADEKGRRWYTAWTRTTPWDVMAYTGLYHGSAGCASSLLTWYAKEQKITGLPGMLEDPIHS